MKNNMNIFKFEFRRLFKSCLVWSLLCGALIILFMAFFPSMRDSGIQELVATKLGAFPEGLMEAFGLDDMVDFTDIMQYLAYVIQYISMAAAVYGAILGVNALLEEEAEGTIEFLYAQPVSRSEIVTSKILSRVVIMFLFIIIVGSTTMGISIALKPEDVDLITMLMDIKSIFIGMSFIGFIYLAIGLLLSTILKPSSNSTAISIGVFFITYILGVLSKMKDNLEGLKYLSPFDYALPMDIVRSGWNINYIITGIGIIAISIIGTYIIYNKKDMRI